MSYVHLSIGMLLITTLWHLMPIVPRVLVRRGFAAVVAGAPPTPFRVFRWAFGPSFLASATVRRLAEVRVAPLAYCFPRRSTPTALAGVECEIGSSEEYELKTHSLEPGRGERREAAIGCSGVGHAHGIEWECDPRHLKTPLK